MCILDKTLSILPRGLTLSFSLSIKFCPLPICRFPHLHTLIPSDTQRRICPNLVTLIFVMRNSHQQFFNFFFFILQTSRPLNLRSSQFHTLSCAASRQKKHPQEQRFPVLLVGKNRTTGAENLVPIDSKCMRSQGRKKTCPSASLIQKQTCRTENIFSNAGKN